MSDERRHYNDSVRAASSFTDDDVIRALADLEREQPSAELFPAKFIATRMHLRGFNRLGTKSSRGGNWSGMMSPALRVAATLRRLHRQGKVHGVHDHDNHRWLYRLPRTGDRKYTPPPKPPKPKPVKRPRKPDHLLPRRRGETGDRG